jgi:putative ABC transport system permease protein
VVLRTAGDPLALVSAVQEAVLDLDNEQPTFDFATMQGRLAESLAEQRLNMWLLAAFAFVALALAAGGIYGITSYFVMQQTHEIGVRMALGASQKRILSLVLQQGTISLLGGLVVGLFASLGFTRFLVGLIYNIRPTDLATYCAVGSLLSGVALMAAYIPARRAAKVDPMVALRYE